MITEVVVASWPLCRVWCCWAHFHRTQPPYCTLHASPATSRFNLPWRNGQPQLPYPENHCTIVTNTALTLAFLLLWASFLCRRSSLTPLYNLASRTQPQFCSWRAPLTARRYSFHPSTQCTISPLSLIPLLFCIMFFSDLYTKWEHHIDCRERNWYASATKWSWWLVIPGNTAVVSISHL